MICPRCGSSTRVFMEKDYAQRIVRVRECNWCGLHFITEATEHTKYAESYKKPMPHGSQDSAMEVE